MKTTIQKLALKSVVILFGLSLVAPLRATITTDDLQKVVRFIQEENTNRAQAEITILLDDNPNDPIAPRLREAQKNPNAFVSQIKTFAEARESLETLTERANLDDKVSLETLRQAYKKFFTDWADLLRPEPGTAEEDETQKMQKALADPDAFATELKTARSQAESVRCENNLKQIGVAFRLWESDNGDRYPQHVLASVGGTMSFRKLDNQGFDLNSFRHFQVMSNELSTPKILVCPSDTNRQPAIDFQSLRAENVTYQLRTGKNVTESYPDKILAYCPIHGHVLLCDGSVQAGYAKTHKPPADADDGVEAQTATVANSSVNTPPISDADLANVTQLIQDGKAVEARDAINRLLAASPNDPNAPKLKKILGSLSTPNTSNSSSATPSGSGDDYVW